jgi:hypothetical protein
MMMLQETVSTGVQVSGGLLLVGNTLMLLKLTFGAGRYIEKVDACERRIAKLEDDKGCGADDCPLHKN